MKGITTEEILGTIWEKQAYNPGIEESIIGYFIDPELTHLSDERVALRTKLSQLAAENYLAWSSHEYTYKDGTPMRLWIITQKGIDYMKLNEIRNLPEKEKEAREAYLNTQQTETLYTILDCIKGGQEQSDKTAKYSICIAILSLIITVLSLLCGIFIR